MNKKYNILVTGCGGDIGQSIGKILKSHNMFDSVIGCDMNDQHAGKFIYDKCLKIPACRSEQYASTLTGIIEEFRIDLILPASEPELRYYTEKSITDQFLDRPVICANLTAREIGFDKLLTVNLLKSEGLPFPVTHVAGEMKEPCLPLILKNRKGSGSKSMYLIRDMSDYVFYAGKHPDFIAQEFIESSDEEYTCGLFREKKGQTRTIVYKRRLMGGFTGFGVVIQDKDIDQLLLNIAEKLDLSGAINVQLRLSKKGPLVFEINPRFSSTVRFRHLMGFEDVIWSVQDRLNMDISAYAKPRIGTQFYKGFNEYVD